MKIRNLLIVFLIICFYNITFSQTDVQIGSPNLGTTRAQTGGVFDYSDPTAINIKVQLWGYVRYAGYYIVPIGTSLNELISFAGGPTENAQLDNIRVTKIKEGAVSKIVKYNYNDLMWSDELDTLIIYDKLEAGDIVVVPGEPRYFARDNFTFLFSIFTSLASLAALIITIVRR